jgi:hypothetical protein
MLRVDPADTGGLFISRRPGTGPVQFRRAPAIGGALRRGLLHGLATLLLGAMLICNLCFWGPVEVAWLWVGGHVQYYTDHLATALLVAFAGILITLFGGLVALKHVDQAWILTRRAAGHDQREGVLARIFVVTCALGTVGFGIWFLGFSGADLMGGGLPGSMP